MVGNVRVFAGSALRLWERGCSRRGRVRQGIRWLTLRIREQARSHILIATDQRPLAPLLFPC
ncbi:hypothetical protein CWC48_21150 [Pseudomonas sp. S10E 269]|nr:hypothetical protein CWC49_01600 [Pseudomonas sp. S09F 262]PJK41540.1 hypothetical protein CWC48_21150 [Pseudomonas sp. S10E 269]